MSSSKRHFTVVINSNEHGLYVSSTPSSAARKAVSKLCADNKKKKVEFSIREITQGSNKKVYGPYIGYMQKLDNPIELEGRVIRYKPIVKLNKKSHKLKGGAIIGQGKEGIVLRPNINSKNENQVSKLIKATIDQQDQLIAFENRLNQIDKSGQYHVKMLDYRGITSRRINSINNNNVNLDLKKEMKIKYNFKITYQFGGISISDFLDDFINYQDKVNNYFIQRLLRGILNCFIGLYKFYKNGIIHLDLHSANIVFLIDEPQVMRIIDWGILLENNGSSNGSNDTLNPEDIMIFSLYKFYYITKKLFSRFKLFMSEKKNIVDILNNFLEIPNFKIYFYYGNNLPPAGRILNESELEEVRVQMEQLIEQL